MGSRLPLLWLCVLALSVSGCLTLKHAPPPPKPVAPIEGARPLRLGAVTGEGLVNVLTLRANPLSPSEGTWVTYLETALRGELQTRGLLDPGADKALDAVLLENSISAGISTAHGVLRVRFIVSQGPQNFYDREQRVVDEWESSFFFEVVLAELQTEYPMLYRHLFDVLFADPDFQAALRR